MKKRQKQTYITKGKEKAFVVVHRHKSAAFRATETMRLGEIERKLFWEPGDTFEVRNLPLLEIRGLVLCNLGMRFPFTYYSSHKKDNLGSTNQVTELSFLNLEVKPASVHEKFFIFE